MWVRGSAAILATKRLAGVKLRAESEETVVCKQQNMQTIGCTMVLKHMIDVHRSLKRGVPVA